MLRLNHPCLSEDYLATALNTKLTGLRLNSSSHMVNNHSFLFWSIMAKTRRPPFESLEAEGETVLSWREATAVVNHSLVSSEHVPSLEIFHLKISIG